MAPFSNESFPKWVQRWVKRWESLFPDCRVGCWFDLENRGYFVNISWMKDNNPAFWYEITYLLPNSSSPAVKENRVAFRESADHEVCLAFKKRGRVRYG